MFLLHPKADQKSLFNINSASAAAVVAVVVVVGVVVVVAAAAAPNLADDVQHGNDGPQKHFSFFRRFEQR